jgi:hypothetical protein
MTLNLLLPGTVEIQQLPEIATITMSIQPVYIRNSPDGMIFQVGLMVKS